MTVSYELAEKLKDAGIVVESEKFWAHDGEANEKITCLQGHLSTWENLMEICPAPMLHELLPLIPEQIINNEMRDFFWFFIKDDELKTYETGYDHSYPHWVHFEDKNPAEACANLLLWLKDNRYLEEK